MIMDELALRWRRTDDGIGPRGEQCVRHDCVEHPRVFKLSQRASADADWCVSYHVDGIPAQHWATAEDAIMASEANP